MSDEAAVAGKPHHAPGSQTPVEIVAQSKLAQMLRNVGATDADLDSLQFSKFKPDDPFNRWAVWAPGTLEQKERLEHLLIGHAALCKAFCAYRWLVLADPPSSPNREAAWDYISRAIAAPIIELGLKTLENQQKRAQKPRVAKGERGETLHQIIATLASKPEYRDLRAKELWPHFRSALEDHGLDPKDVAAVGDMRTAVLTYDFREGRRRISFGSFANTVSRLRKKS